MMECTTFPHDKGNYINRIFVVQNARGEKKMTRDDLDDYVNDLMDEQRGKNDEQKNNLGISESK